MQDCYLAGHVLRSKDEVCDGWGLGVKKGAQTRGENRTRKRLVTDLSRDKVMLRDVLRKKALRSAQRKALVGHLMDRY